jgi:hypothetical protein
MMLTEQMGPFSKISMLQIKQVDYTGEALRKLFKEILQAIKPERISQGVVGLFTCSTQLDNTSLLFDCPTLWYLPLDFNGQAGQRPVAFAFLGCHEFALERKNKNQCYC